MRPAGGGRLAFILQYRVKGDPKARRLTLGHWPDTKPDRIREEAREIKTAAQLGRDLVAERRKVVEVAPGVAPLLTAWRAATEAEIAAKLVRGESVLYERELLRLEVKILRPAIGQLEVSADISKRLQALINTQTSASTARNLRNLAVRVSRFMVDHLVLKGEEVDLRVAFDAPKPPRSRDNRYSLEEMGALWSGAMMMGRRGVLIAFMMLTGCRRIEAQNVRWEHLTLGNGEGVWEQPSSMTKNHQAHRVPLTEPAVVLLRWMGGTDSPLVFPGRGGKKIGGWTDVRRHLLVVSGVDGGTLHDFRRTVVSTLGDHGFDPQIADSLLNHSAANTMSGVMGVYQRSEFWTKKVEAMKLWSDLLTKAVGERKWRPMGAFENVRIKRPRAAGSMPPTG